MHLRLDHYACSLSPLLLLTDDAGNLRALEFADHAPRMHRLLREHYDDYILQAGPAPPETVSALDAFFNGELGAVNAIKVATAGTAFQREVWRALRAIPAGTTMSYGELAAQLCRPGASRAVGAANGSNPVAIVVPCHRVIGANGTLTGYGGGLPRKRWLLDHEQKYSTTKHVDRNLKTTTSRDLMPA